MPSPAVQIKEGAGAYQSAVGGFNATPAAAITINLISSAGVSTWSIQCISTDELSDAATVNSSLTIDTVAKTATFTAPVAGRTYRFQSQINGGIGVDGTAQSSYTTTFCVYTRYGGRRVHAVDETFESNATFGWVADLNDLIRTPPSSTFTSIDIQDLSSTDQYTITGSELAADRTCTLPALTGNDTFVFQAHTQTLTNKTLTAPTVTGGAFSSPVLTTPQINDTSSDHQYVFAGSELAADRTVTLPLLTGDDTFVFAAHSQTLTNKTLTSPAISGGSWATPTLTGAVTISSASTTTVTSSDSKVTTIDAIGSHETSNATPAAAYTSPTLTDEAVHSIEVIVTAIKSDGTAAACYKRHLAGRRDGGSWTQLAAVSDDKTEETTAAWDCTVDVSSNTFRVMVTGAAATTIRWGYSVRIQSTVP